MRKGIVVNVNGEDRLRLAAIVANPIARRSMSGVSASSC
jgi:hypothetical protein